MTASWAVDIAPHRDLDLRWRSISLLEKNQPPPDSDYYAPAEATHQMLRVMEAARAAAPDPAAGDEAFGKLYFAFGNEVHGNQNLHPDIGALLESAGLDPALAAASDDESWDEVIRSEMDEGLALTGADVGTPLLAFDDADGERVGMFGPVISRRPKGELGLQLWDGLVACATVPGFWELKRTRTEGPVFD